MSLRSGFGIWRDGTAILNQLGNEGAHPEDYDDVTLAEATELGRFVRNLLLLEYEMPARIARTCAAAANDAVP